MSRSRWLALAVVVLAAAGALVFRVQSGGAHPSTAGSSLAPLVARAALGPCEGEVSLSSAPGISAVPVVRLPCLDGTGSRDLTGGGGHGRPTLVNVYGSWCQPCAREMPLLREFRALADGRVRLVGVDTEDDPRLALLFAIDLQQHWPALRDDQGVVSRAFGGGAPKTLFVTAAGQVVHVQRGAFPSLDVLRADVRRFLGVTV